MEQTSAESPGFELSESFCLFSLHLAVILAVTRPFLNPARPAPLPDTSLQFPPHLSPSSQGFLARLLAKQPRQRLGSVHGVVEVKGAQFFCKVDWNRLLRKQVTAPIVPCKAASSVKGAENFDTQFTSMPIDKVR